MTARCSPDVGEGDRDDVRLLLRCCTGRSSREPQPLAYGSVSAQLGIKQTAVRLIFGGLSPSASQAVNGNADFAIFRNMRQGSYLPLSWPPPTKPGQPVASITGDSHVYRSGIPCRPQMPPGPDPCRRASSQRSHGRRQISEACRAIVTGGTFLVMATSQSCTVIHRT
jgi:hypothetical protein